jgi:methyltransferase (TIGR00027 family)
MTVKEASRTAVLVCQARAVADDRLAIGRFSDPVAVHLLRDSERVAVDRVRSGTIPDSWRERLEAAILDATTTAMVSRTVVVDDAVRAKANPQLVILGAGLDARAYRLPELAEVDVYEVDHPASQLDKRDRINGQRLVAKSLSYVAVDFGRDPLGPALATAGHLTTTPTTWIWEGVLLYLTEADVNATLTMIDECSAPGSRLIVHYSTPSRLSAMRGRARRVISRLIGARDPWENEPRVSFWHSEAIRTLTTANNFAVTDDQDLPSAARQLGISARQARQVRLDHVAIADKQTIR